MSSDEMKRYLEEIDKNKGTWTWQTYPIDFGVKLMLPPDDIARGLVHGGYYSDLKVANQRVRRHLLNDTKEKRAQRCIVSLRVYHDYLIKYGLPQPNSSKGYS